MFTRTDSSGTANFHTDALGSTINLTNSSGSSIAQYAYEPFGNTTVTSGSSTNSFQYTGRENDGDGVYFNRNRYYSPTLQRFISEDPAFPTGGINAYAYASNNPVFWTDPFGLSPTPITPWDRLKLVGQAVGSTAVGLGKLGVGTGAAAAAPESGGLSLALTYYSWYSSLGNFGAAGADIYGAFSGNVTGAQHAADVSSAASSISGLATWIGTGNVSAGATASNIEGIGLFGLSGGLGVPIHLSDVYDLVDSGSGVVAPATH